MGIAVIAARRYASALLDVASERGLADRCLADLEAFSRQVDKVPGLRDAIADPSIPREAMTRVVTTIARRMFLNELSVAFLGVLASHRRLAGLPSVLAAYAQEQDRRAGRARGELVSAAPVSQTQVARIREAVGRVLGRRLLLTEKVDPHLLGGVRVTVGDRVFDMSVRSYLDSLRTHLLEIR